MPTRYFTVSEANAALPRVKQLVEEILAARQHILDAQPDLWPVLEKAVGNGGSKKAGAVLGDFTRLEQSVQKLTDIGCILKDINSGLVDFPTLRGGHEVLLCWRYGEPSVSHWHELDAGFAGRQPL